MNAISEILHKTPVDVLNELLEIEKEKPNFEALNHEELLFALNEKHPYITM